MLKMGLAGGRLPSIDECSLVVCWGHFFKLPFFVSRGLRSVEVVDDGVGWG